MSDKIIVTICREFCSGGVEIGKKLASKLEFDFYDKELISLASKKSGYVEDVFKGADEKPNSSFLYSVAIGSAELAGLFFQKNDVLTNDKLFGIQSEVIKEIAQKGSSIIVGRCSDYILRDEEKIVRVYLRADLDFKVKRLLEQDNKVNAKDAENILRKADKKRASYYNYYTGNTWDSVTNYDIVLNTSKLGIDGAVDQIINYINTIR